MKKYVYLSMRIRNGEYEYNSRSVHQLDQDKDLTEFSREYSKGFYGGEPFQYDEPEDPDGWWYFNGGEVASCCQRIEEITKEEYDVLQKYNW